MIFSLPFISQDSVQVRGNEREKSGIGSQIRTWIACTTCQSTCATCRNLK